MSLRRAHGEPVGCESGHEMPGVLIPLCALWSFPSLVSPPALPFPLPYSKEEVAELQKKIGALEQDLAAERDKATALEAEKNKAIAEKTQVASHAVALAAA